MTALAHVSLAQALSIWTDLEEARLGCNAYGGNTAEIYVYRLLDSRPSGHVPDDYRRANAALYDLLVMFQEAHDVHITTGATRDHDGYPLTATMRHSDHPHRWHIRIRDGRTRRRTTEEPTR